jgi:hypothetical protein
MTLQQQFVLLLLQEINSVSQNANTLFWRNILQSSGEGAVGGRQQELGIAHKLTQPIC